MSITKVFFAFLSVFFCFLITSQAQRLIAEQAYSTPFNIGDYVIFEIGNGPGQFLRHSEGNVRISAININDCNQLALWDAVFKVEKGLANNGDAYFSFRSVNISGHYLRHQNGNVKISPKSNDRQFQEDATWLIGKSFSGSDTWSFRMLQARGIYLRHQNVNVKISEIHNKQVDKLDASWRIIVRNDLKSNIDCPIIKPGEKLLTKIERNDIGFTLPPNCNRINGKSFRSCGTITVFNNGKITSQITTESGRLLEGFAGGVKIEFYDKQRRLLYSITTNAYGVNPMESRTDHWEIKISEKVVAASHYYWVYGVHLPKGVPIEEVITIIGETIIGSPSEN